MGTDPVYHMTTYHPDLIQTGGAPNWNRKSMKSSKKKIIVDGNNVAYSSGSPRIHNLKSVRSELIKQGYEPIIVVSSALFHNIDNRDELQRLHRIGWISVADENDSDDIEIIELAVRYNCEIVSNDRYLDHRGNYRGIFDFSKLRKFAISNGKVILS